MQEFEATVRIRSSGISFEDYEFVDNGSNQFADSEFFDGNQSDEGPLVESSKGKQKARDIKRGRPPKVISTPIVSTFDDGEGSGESNNGKQEMHDVNNKRKRGRPPKATSTPNLKIIPTVSVFDDGESRPKRSKATKNNPKLPVVPPFASFEHSKPFLSNPSIVPGHLSEVPSIIEVFRHFFPDTMLKTIVINTNYYAAVKDAEEKGRVWKNLTMAELLIFIAICIYFGLFRANRALEWMWDKDPRKPNHPILEYMSLFRFQQIKRFLHISLHGHHNNNYYAKVEPLLSHIRETSQLLYRPRSNISVDEMMIRFLGRSRHTFRMKGKPTPEGFKIQALCDHGL